MEDLRIVVEGKARNEDEALEKAEAIQHLLEPYGFKVNLVALFPPKTLEDQRAEASRWN